MGSSLGRGENSSPAVCEQMHQRLVSPVQLITLWSRYCCLLYLSPSGSPLNTISRAEIVKTRDGHKQNYENKKSTPI